MPSNAQALPFTALTMSVGDLLANPFYIQAPPYQRSFSWGEQEAGKLLEDITSVPSLDAGGDNGVYFLGAMLFIERERPQPPSRLKPWQRPQMRSLEVVDGLASLTRPSSSSTCALPAPPASSPSVPTSRRRSSASSTCATTSSRR